MTLKCCACDNIHQCLCNNPILLCLNNSSTDSIGIIKVYYATFRSISLAWPHHFTKAGGVKAHTICLAPASGWTHKTRLTRVTFYWCTYTRRVSGLMCICARGIKFASVTANSRLYFWIALTVWYYFYFYFISFSYTLNKQKHGCIYFYLYNA